MDYAKTLLCKAIFNFLLLPFVALTKEKITKLFFMQQSLSNALPFFDEAIKLTDKIFFAFDVDSNKFLYLNPAVEQACGISIENLSKNPAA